MNVFKQIQQLFKRYDDWARVRKIDPVITYKKHTCSNCQTEYIGNFCPQCGLRFTLQHLKLKNLFYNFMDIWGLGSRPMFRTIGELFTRPGYMIREYLSGHQPLYFPPFKMIVIVSVVYLLVAWIRGVPIDGLNLDFYFSWIEDEKLSPHGHVVMDYLGQLIDWFNDHLAFSVIIGQTLSVVAMRIGFRRAKQQWSLVELFFAHIYSMVQYYLIASLCILVFGCELDEMPALGLLSVVIVVYKFLTMKQLYDLGIWRTLLYWLYKKLWELLFLLVIIIVIGVTVYTI